MPEASLTTTARLWTTLSGRLDELRMAAARAWTKTSMYAEGHNETRIRDVEYAIKLLRNYCIDGIGCTRLHPGLEITARRMFWANNKTDPNYAVPYWYWRDTIDPAMHQLAKRTTRSEKDTLLSRDWARVLAEQLEAFRTYLYDEAEYMRAWNDSIALRFYYEGLDYHSDPHGASEAACEAIQYQNSRTAGPHATRPSVVIEPLFLS